MLLLFEIQYDDFYNSKPKAICVPDLYISTAEKRKQWNIEFSPIEIIPYASSNYNISVLYNTMQNKVQEYIQENYSDN